MIFTMTPSEKRQATRLPLEVRVQLQRGDHVQTHLCSDISSGGLFVRTEESWRNGERVTVRIFLPGLSTPIVMNGEVVRGAAGGVGVRFIETNRDLARFCQSRGGEVLAKAAKNILVGHEKEAMRYFLRSVLAAEGYRVRECKSLDEIVNALKASPYDLLVGDPLLEDAKGHILADWLAKHPFPGHVVMVTEGEVVGHAPLAGDFALVKEPVELSSFRRLVWNLVS